MGKDIYRSRLEKPLDEKVLEFISSLEEDLWIIKEDIIGTEVHNIMLYEQKMLNKNEIKLILKALEHIKEKVLKNQFELDRNFEDIHPLIEKLVIDEIGIDIGGKIHTGRSRNDQVSVDMRLKIREELNRISNGLFNLFDVLINVSKNNIESFFPLYTHLQSGQLGVFAHYINYYNAQLLRSLERIEEIYKRINMNPLGACAIGGTSINIDRKRTAELLGFEGIIENSIDAISSRDYVYETLMSLSLIAIQFSRIAEDLLLWSSREFGFIELDDKYCSVSSVMPQKKNPDVIELIRSKSSKIVSNSFSASMIIKAIPSGYFRDFQDLKMLLKSSFDLVLSIIDMCIGIFSTIKINKDRAIQVINESFILALDLAEFLVQDYGIPFRQSHQIVANLVKGSQNSSDMFNKAKIERTIFEITKKKINIPEENIASIKDLKQCLNKRISFGSPSKEQVEIAIKSLEEKENPLFNHYLKRIEKIKYTKDLREDLIKDLIS